MTKQQIELLKRLIEADRLYRTRIKNGEPVHNDERGVEVGWINGVNPRTAEALLQAGVIEITCLPPNNRPYIFLGKYQPYDSIEEK